MYKQYTGRIMEINSKESPNVKKAVLFVCTHNSVRSQMAEGLLRSKYGDSYEAQSTGIMPTRVKPWAIKVMSEVGIDIWRHRSKSIDEFRGITFDYVVTVCDRAKVTCPAFLKGKATLHKAFDDPSSAKGTESEILEFYRRVRDEIGSWLDETFAGRQDGVVLKCCRL
jgi:arsenate reductase